MTEAQARALVGVLKAAYPRQELPQPTIELYRRQLEELDARLARVAIERIVRTSRFFPTVAELLAEVASLSRPDLPDPDLAWSEVCAEMRRVGGDSAPRWSCPEVAIAVRSLGSWSTLCRSKNPVADRKRFVDAYRAARNNALEGVQLGTRLATLSDQVSAELRGEATAKQIGDGKRGSDG